MLALNRILDITLEVLQCLAQFLLSALVGAQKSLIPGNNEAPHTTGRFGELCMDGMDLPLGTQAALHFVVSLSRE